MGVGVTLDLKPADRDHLSALLARHLPGVAVWAFGSRVDGRAKPASDLDLVAWVPPAWIRRVPDLREALEESPISIRVDLHVWRELPEAFRANIHSNHLVLQEPKGPKPPEYPH
jgi:uncharacterized protein